MSVRIIQCLCPSDHCILAIAYEKEPDGEMKEVLLDGIEMMVGGGGMNPWCELCKAPREKWYCRVSTTPFQTLKEAEPFLYASEAAQLETQRTWKAGRN